MSDGCRTTSWPFKSGCTGIESVGEHKNQRKGDFTNMTQGVGGGGGGGGGWWGGERGNNS